MVRCTTAGTTLDCSATHGDDGSVTARASWSVSETWREGMDLPVPVSDAVSFPEPGRPRVHRRANVYIRADYVSAKWGRARSLAPFAYEVSPDAAPVPLAYMSGFTFLGEGTSLIGGVTVEVMDGPSRGRRTVSGENGFYMLEFLPIRSPLVFRASKSGYGSDTREAGIDVDPAYQVPINSTLHFHLSPPQ